VTDQRPGGALPGDEIGGELGRGAMGEVQAGRHTRLDRDIAIMQGPEGFDRYERTRGRFGDESLAATDGEIIGTPAHMVPEQVEGVDIGAAVDVYAVGAMFDELLSGRLPFDEPGDAGDLLRARTTQEP